ncbi:hypothetical protein FQA47_005273 [Oryzias melastigma]|uniref:Uncharacterized protein n=1 Tax=Oryzias melastigma TaxID=30732 RepID=A0A834FAU7_ORYME|nr:hypothetical protein FQA47_005273 [Oryzias melastigma]
MTDTDLAKYIPKVGDRVSTVAFRRRNALSESVSSRKESILSRLRQRLRGTEEPVKKRCAKLDGNVNAKRQMRRIEIGWMDFDETAQRYKQLSELSGRTAGVWRRRGSRRHRIDRGGNVGASGRVYLHPVTLAVPDDSRHVWEREQAAAIGSSETRDSPLVVGTRASSR